MQEEAWSCSFTQAADYLSVQEFLRVYDYRKTRCKHKYCSHFKLVKTLKRHVETARMESAAGGLDLTSWWAT